MPARGHPTNKGSSVRGEKHSTDLNGPSLTGPGYIFGGKLVASLESDAVDLVENTTESRLNTCVDREGDFTVYVFHEVCWELLLQRMSPRVVSEAGPSLIAGVLFHLLASLPYSRVGGLITRDGYLGAVDLRRPSQSVNRWNFGYYGSDPNPNLSIETDGMDTDSKVDYSPQRHFTSHQEPSVDEPFSRLPLEIMQDIFDILPSKDLCTARLASRYFALHAGPASLPKTFWPGRFADDKEMGFIDLEYIPRGEEKIGFDFYRLYRRCQQALNSEDIRKGLLNRKRIWSCLGHFAKTLDACLSCPSDVLRMGDGQWSAQQPRLPDSYYLGQRVACPKLSYVTADHGDLAFGARVCFSQTLVFRSGDDALRATVVLEYSTIVFHAETFISGFRVFTSSKRSGSNYSHEAGMMRTPTPGSITLEPNASIHEIVVHMSISGIHGMILNTKSLDGTVMAYSIGDTITRAGQRAVTRLEARGTITGFLVGFDVLSSTFFSSPLSFTLANV